MTTRMLLESFKYGAVASAVAFSIEAHAGPPGRAGTSLLQIATGQYVTPTAVCAARCSSI